MTDIKLIEKDTNIAELKIEKLNWDVVMRGKPFYVVRIEGYVHTIGGKYGDNNLWAYPRDEEPSYKNLIEFDSEPVLWGINFNPHHYVKSKWDETEMRYSGEVTITRNGEDFYTLWGGINYGIDKARVLISEIEEHPLGFNEIDYDTKMIGRKVWWRSQPAVITYLVRGQACVILNPDGIEKFKMSEEFKNDDAFNEELDIKADIFDRHVWWFRD